MKRDTYISHGVKHLKNAPNRKKFHQGLAIASSHMIYYHFITYQIGQDVEKQHCFWGVSLLQLIIWK